MVERHLATGADVTRGRLLLRQKQQKLLRQERGEWEIDGSLGPAPEPLSFSPLLDSFALGLQSALQAPQVGRTEGGARRMHLLRTLKWCHPLCGNSNSHFASLRTELCVHTLAALEVS